MSKITKAIEDYIKKHKGEVAFIGSFVAFDKKGDVIDDRMFAYGDRGTLEISLESLEETLEKDKEDFINW
jgi:NAD/NADP transhydrogenase beta subunit